MCPAAIIGWHFTTPPPSFGLIYEGAIGQPRWTTSLCDPLPNAHIPAGVKVPADPLPPESEGFFFLVFIHRHFLTDNSVGTGFPARSILVHGTEQRIRHWRGVAWVCAKWVYIRYMYVNNICTCSGVGCWRGAEALRLSLFRLMDAIWRTKVLYIRKLKIFLSSVCALELYFLAMGDILSYFDHVASWSLLAWDQRVKTREKTA